MEVFKSTDERDLHLHIFRPDDSLQGDRGAVLFFHGGGFATTRVEQFERQAQLLADAGIVGIVVEFRVTAEGTTRSDAIEDGADALDFVVTHAASLAIDPQRVAMAGASAGGALATEASPGTSALVLFNPAVNASSAGLAGDVPSITFHSREDTVIPFSSAEGFCDAAADCELIAFDEGDHGFFNNEPAFTETTNAMIEFLRSQGW